MSRSPLPSQILIQLLCILFPLSQSGYAQKRPFETRDAFRIKQIHSLRNSPRGDQLLFISSERSLADNRLYSSVWVMPTAGGQPKPLTDPKGRVSNPQWSPDGTRIAYFSSDQQGLGLWVMDRYGFLKRKLTGLERSNADIGLGDLVGNDLCWSPDGKTLAYNAAGPRHYTNIPSPLDPPNGNDVMIVDRLMYKAFYYYSDLRRTHVWLISAEGGTPTQISSGDYDYHSISWSPDGKRIVAVSNQTGEDDFNANNDLVMLSTEGKPMVRLTNTKGPEYNPVWSPDGAWIAYQGRLRPGRSKESDAEFQKVYIVRPEGGQPRDVTSTLDMWCNAITWAPDSTRVYFVVDTLGKLSLYSASIKTESLVPVIEEKGQITSFTLGPRLELFYVFTDFTQPGEIYRAAPDGSDRRKLTTFNQEMLNEVHAEDGEWFSYPSFDGVKIEGWLIRPAGFTAGRRYPMILDIHGGPHAAFGYNLARNVRLQVYAGNGYAVLMINPRGSSGYGQKFSDMVVGPLWASDYKDLMAGVDYVLKKYAFIDADRLGVSGVSHGGYMTNWITTHTDRFKAAVPISGICNLISGWGINENFLWFESDLGFIPYDDYNRAWEVSPLKYVKNCKTPTLFIHGAWDFNTSLNQAEEMYMALKRLRVDTVMAIYPNEGHGVNNQPIHTYDYYERSLTWFDNYLKPTGQ